jgi:PAS domain S-box-containing protein
VRRDGLTLWVNIRVYFLREKEGRRMFYASLTDMTSKKAETKIPVSMNQDMTDFSEEQIAELERYYGNLPVPFAIYKPYINSEGRPYYFQIKFANTKMSQIGGGDMQRLSYLIQCLFQEKQESFLNAMCAAAYDNVESEDYVYSDVSNRYYDLKWYQYKEGYACCMMEDATHSHIYESVSGNIMQSFREVYFLHLNDNYCRMLYPYADDILRRGNFDEMVSRAFESGKIRPFDEKGVREFLSIDNLKKALRKRDSVEYKYKRSIYPAGEEWCVTTVTVSKREDGIPKTATMTIRSIESLMREKENEMHMDTTKILETMAGGFFTYLADGDERMLYVNPAVLHLFGCKNKAEFEALTGNTFTGFVHPDDIKRIEWEIKSQIEETDRNMDYIRYRIIRKDGEVRWVDDVGHLETTEYTEEPRVFYVFISDITDSMTEAEKTMLIGASKRFNES